MLFQYVISLAILSQLSLGAVGLPAAAVSDSWPQEILNTCQQSVNCKVVNGKPVMDSASTHTKRMLSVIAGGNGIGPNTTSIVANTGTINTSTCLPSDMVNQALGENCSKQGCSTDPKTFKCPHPSSENPGSDLVTCTVVQEGTYPLDDSGFYPKMFTAALKQAADAFTKPKETTVAQPVLKRNLVQLDSRFNVKRIGGPPIVTFHNVQFNSSIIPSSIAAATSQAITINGQTTKVMVGSVRFTIQCEDPDKPSCSDILGDAGALSSVLSLFAPEVIGPLVSAAVGVVSLFCGSS